MEENQQLRELLGEAKRQIAYPGSKEGRELISKIDKVLRGLKKRKDECLFCSSRSCHTRIVRLENPVYDEVACSRHVANLEDHSDSVLGRKNGVMRNHITSSSKMERGEQMDCIKS
jgi:hypothetical protein